jgi:hypothetical protein
VLCANVAGDLHPLEDEAGLTLAAIAELRQEIQGGAERMVQALADVKSEMRDGLATLTAGATLPSPAAGGHAAQGEQGQPREQTQGEPALDVYLSLNPTDAGYDRKYNFTDAAGKIIRDVEYQSLKTRLSSPLWQDGPEAKVCANWGFNGTWGQRTRRYAPPGVGRCSVYTH